MNNAHTACTTCGRPAAAPFRRAVNGVVVEGCIDAAHDAHADAWHLRPAAQVFRLESRAYIAGLLGRHEEAAEAASEADMLRREHSLRMPRSRRRRAA